MSEPSLAQLIWEYLKATVSYWWLIVPGVLMPLPDLWKYLHPQRRELSIPKWLRWTLPLLCLSLAQFLAYRNASINLSQVIEEKKQLGIRNNALNSELEQEKQKSTNARPFREPSDSLRKRTMRAADELHEYLEKRAEGRPPDAWPNSNEPDPSPERKAAIKLSQSYAQETQDYYMKHFKDRLMGIVKEYESIGVPTRHLENDFKQRVPGIAEAGSAWEGMDDLSRFRELAYRVDARNHLIVF